MAQLWTTGPAFFYLMPTGGSFASALYLGTAERPPEIHLRPAYEPVFNQLGGTRIPFDQCFEGLDALISADINRFNMTPMIAIEDYVRTSSILLGGGALIGSSIPGDIGTLMIQESACHTIIMAFPYSQKPAMAGQVPGYVFDTVVVEGNTLQKAGTIERNHRLVWHALRFLDMTVENAFGRGALNAYRILPANAGLSQVD